MLESQLEGKVVAFCKRHGILCYKFTSPAHRGVPDRMLVKDGKVMWLELKRPGKGKLTALQVHEIDRLLSQRMFATWTDNYDEAVKIVSQHFGL